MWTELFRNAGSVVALLALTFAIVTQVRASSQRKHAERAETAMRLLEALQRVDVGGVSTRLDASLALKIHNEQVHGLQEVVRINIAEFERRSKRAGFPLELHFLIGFVGLLLLSIVPGIVGQLSLIDANSRWVGVVFALLVGLSGGAMLWGLIATLVRRLTARKVNRRAGMYVPSALEVASEAYIGFRTWRNDRSLKRRR